MEKCFPLLARSPLFEGIEEHDLPALLDCLGATTRHFAKKQTVLNEGAPVRHIGIVLKGRVLIVQDDVWGNRSVLGGIEPGQLFAEAFAFAKVNTLPVSIVADLDSDILLLDHSRMLRPCQNACRFHAQLIDNIMRILAQKNLLLRQKLEFLSQRTTRGKLLAYLLAQAKQNKNKRFTIPFDRQALADYLGVDRSAMCVELSKLKRDGLIAFNKSAFELLAPLSDISL